MSIDPPITFRHLTAPADGMELVSLLWHKGSPWIGDIRRRIDGQIPGAEDHFFVALVEGRAVATAWYTRSQSEPRLGLLGHVYTRPEHRRRGLSKELVDRAMADFHGRGGVVMQLFSSTPYTIPFYEKLGFENLYANQAYHETDWYMRHPVDSQPLLVNWRSSSPCTVRPLSGGDLPQYCLLYNGEHASRLKDWAQLIGLGLEAEFAFIHSLEKVSQGEGVCCVLEKEQSIVGAASLMLHPFPHHSHVAALDFYVQPEFAVQSGSLVEACLSHRDELGAEIIYAMAVDPSKRSEFSRIGFHSQAILPRHYKVGNQYFDSELFTFPASRQRKESV